MKKIILAGVIVIISAACTIQADAAVRTVTTTTNVPGTVNNIYLNDIIQIERYLFGRIYSNESIEYRLNRIESELFNRTYPTMNIAQRVNRALENYRDDYYDRNYLSQYYSNNSPSSRIRNRFIGQPTGFTPPIYNTPFNTSRSVFPGINQNYSGIGRSGFSNYVPANTGLGIHILN